MEYGAIRFQMNLDYIKTDEEGNINPSDNPNEGIATRCRVRSRISMDNLSDDGSFKVWG